MTRQDTPCNSQLTNLEAFDHSDIIMLYWKTYIGHCCKRTPMIAHTSTYIVYHHNFHHTDTLTDTLCAGRL